MDSSTRSEPTPKQNGARFSFIDWMVNIRPNQCVVLYVDVELNVINRLNGSVSIKSRSRIDLMLQLLLDWMKSSRSFELQLDQ